MLQRYRKGLALLLVITLVQEIVWPTAAMALTGGPSQPEVESFEPVGTNQMVDLSTGDFTYNIPLMVVPGPNGSYPINLAYHAGIGMEQEASWVGLGWNINPGAITRNMRGLPDDFRGDKIKKTISRKNEVEIGSDFVLPPSYLYEKYGKTLGMAGTGNIHVSYNNYRGNGFQFGLNDVNLRNKKNKVWKNDLNELVNFGFVYDSQTGLGFNPSLNIAQKTREDQNKRKFNGFIVGVGIHSRSSTMNLFVKSRLNINKFNSSNGAISFINNSYLPGVSNSMIGGSLGFTFTKDANIFSYGRFSKQDPVNVDFSVNSIDKSTREFSSYGSIYLEKMEENFVDKNKYDRVTDVNISSSVPLNKNNAYMANPMLQNDVYYVTGQGIAGMFQAHRNDIIFHNENGNTVNSIHVNTGLELGSGNSVDILGSVDFKHLGVDGFGGYSIGYSGKLKGGSANLENLKKKPNSTLNPIYESFYFKMAGEKNVSDNYESINGTNPVDFSVGIEWSDNEDLEGSNILPKPIFRNDNGIEFNENVLVERVKRANNIEYWSKEEVVGYEHYTQRGDYIYPFSEIPDLTNGNQIDYSSQGKDGHIQKFEVLKPDGTRYVYGLPAYNTIQKEVIFANTQYETITYHDSSFVKYDPADASIDNDEGFDHYFQSTEIPEYIHANMITEILSSDYVDLKNDGPTEDDFGFYVKFNYSKSTGFKWRVPFEDAEYIHGNYSNLTDDKASYIYGEKDLYYVNSIETKTHIAFFEVGDRNDGRGVASEHQTEGSGFGGTQKYLKKITLYSKRDIEENGFDNAIPLQTVEFEYSYELCPWIPNNDNSGVFDTNHIQSNQNGKLTLKKVYISYNGNSKGRLSPYEFEYGANPSYKRENIDRWGNYQEPLIEGENLINPYVRQDEDYDYRDIWAGAWNLSQIKMPSGATVNITYEQDDYGFVQDYQATQMCEIYGFSDINDIPALPSGEDRLKLKKDNRRLWFKMNEKFSPSATDDEKYQIVKSYVKGLKAQSKIYFKTFVELKRDLPENFINPKAKDYIEGFLTLKNQGDSFGYLSGNDSLVYVDIEEATYKSAVGTEFNAHPIRKAGWQFIKYERNDLMTEEVGAPDGLPGAVSFFGSLVTFASDAISIISLGYYNQARLMGWCDKLSDDKRSFIRLYSPNGTKYGGGHRVSKIEMTNNWVEGSQVFGNQYEYKLENGESSGVADYEPIAGGEENSVKQPIIYDQSGSYLEAQLDERQILGPLMESAYPAPRVIYSRVVETSLEHLLINNSSNGVKVHEFYTSKDFPVIIENPTEIKQNGYLIPPISIPLLSTSISINMRGYSQGFSVIKNDMSGRVKSVKTFPSNSSFVDEEVISGISYHYKTQPASGRRLQLDNEVDVLTAHGAIQRKEIGTTMDFTVFEEEESTSSLMAGGEFNLDITTRVFTPPPILPPIIVPIPSFYPRFDVAESMYRGISTSKVTSKTAILDKVVVIQDGSEISTKNLLFDAETGEPLLTSVQNEWDKPVYNYNYAAHWAYSGMEGAYRNYRANIEVRKKSGTANYELINSFPVSTTVVISPSEILHVGDELLFNESGTYYKYYVNSIDLTNNEFSLTDEYGTNATFSQNSGVIVRSGHRNLQNAKNGTISALSLDFMGGGNQFFPLFDIWNAQITGSDPQKGLESNNYYFNLNTLSNSVEPFDATTLWMTNVASCGVGGFTNVEIEFLDTTNLNELNFFISGNCNGTITFTGTTPADDGLIFPEAVLPGPGVSSPVVSYTEQLVEFKVINASENGSGDIIVEFLHLPSNQVYNAVWTTSGGDCFGGCSSYDNILHASAITYKDDFGMDYPLADLGNPENENGDPISSTSLNEYRYGKKGIWRVEKSHLYQVGRSQTGVSGSFNTRIDKDGVYDSWVPFDWNSGASNSNWDWVSEMTLYSPYGFALEEKSRLSNGENFVFSSQIYGYLNSVVIAKSQLASYFEIGYRDFEQSSDFKGHLDLSSTGTLTTSSTKSHTGYKSLEVGNSETVSFSVGEAATSTGVLEGLPGKKYIVSLWVNTEAASTSKGTLTIGSQTVNTDDDGGELIDGWKKLEIAFDMPATGSVTVNYTSVNTTFIDDLRFGPFSGGMVTYVYDTRNLWLLSELDALNYATFYNYDSEGNLIQIKKETEKGVITLKTARSNTKQ